MINKYKNLLLLHLIVFIYGFTGILGALITIPSDNLVWYRMMIGFVGIAVYVFLKKALQSISYKEAGQFLLTGIIIALHWIFFFEAIKVSTVSVTLATLSSATLFTALLEPLFFKRRIIPYEAVFGVIIIIGLYMIFSFEPEYRQGIIYTLFSSLMASLFTVINGKFAVKYNAPTVALYEMIGGFLAITIYFVLTSNLNLSILQVSANDLFYLLILGIICTAFAFIVSISIMKELTPYTVTMTINLEPVYGIILAFMIFGETERMTNGFYIGTVLILSTIFANGWFKNRARRKEIASA
jgi:drug/metabolite transporter (DMT)-like permease